MTQSKMIEEKEKAIKQKTFNQREIEGCKYAKILAKIQ